MDSWPFSIARVLIYADTGIMETTIENPPKKMAQEFTQAKSQALSFEQRIDLLKRLKEVICLQEGPIHQALKEDLGKSDFESFIAETGFVVQEINHALRDLKKWMKPKRVATPVVHWPARSFIQKRPFGRALIIGPWNYPFQLLFSPLVGAIAAGNRVVLKPSELAPHCAQIIKKIIDNNFNKAEIEVVLGGVEETSKLLEQKFDIIFYTGSTRVGRIVMQKAAAHLTPVVLELGGKSPGLVFGQLSADELNLVAKRIVWGKFLNSGQTCVAPDYLLVEEDKYASLVQSMRSHIESFYSQDALSSPDYGKIINQNHFERLLGLLYEGQIIYGGKSDKEKLKIGPTLLEVKGHEKVMEEEIFGPLLPIIKVSDLDQAIKFINSRARPLAMYLFSNEQKIQKKVLDEVVSGGICLNDTIVHMSTDTLPFGGVGESGMGSYHGQGTFDVFSHHQSVMKRFLTLDLPLRYPPYKGKLVVVRMIYSILDFVKSIF